jgi:SNF2 family DNA or RNA helicase
MVQFRGDDDTRVVICNRRAAGTGINLVEASYSIVYSRNFSLAEELQSRDRNHRGGSQIHDKVTKIDLCAKDTIDELCLEALLNKQSLAERIIDIAKEL